MVIKLEKYAVGAIVGFMHQVSAAASKKVEDYFDKEIMKMMEEQWRH